MVGPDHTESPKPALTLISGMTEWPADATFPKMDLSDWTTDTILLKFYESLAVLFTHGTYVPRPIGDRRPMSTHYKRALANYTCAKVVCQWWFGQVAEAMAGDDGQCYARSRRGLEACSQRVPRLLQHPLTVLPLMQNTCCETV